MQIFLFDLATPLEKEERKKIIKKRTSHKKVPKSCDLLIVKYQGPPSHVDTTVLCAAKARGPPACLLAIRPSRLEGRKKGIWYMVY